MEYMSLLLNLGEILGSDDNAVDDGDLVNWIMSLGEPSFYTIHIIKDRGNSLFKDGKFSLAGSLYKLALELCCFLAIPPTDDEPVAASLALSLVLNLAASELKLTRYNEARGICNFVLNYDPSNVKALYRRGFALKKLNLLEEAIHDLEHALKLDPKNKDVARELSSVTDCLLVNPNGKRVASPFDPIGKDRKGKKPLHVVEMDNKIEHDSVVTDASCSNLELLENEISCAQNVGCESSDVIMDSTTITEPYPSKSVGYDSNASVSLDQGTSKYSFTNKKQTHKKLSLSAKDYETLKLGRNLQYFHPKSGASITVRPLITKKSILMGTPHEDPSREAVVPSFSPLPINPYTNMDVGLASNNNLIHFDDEDSDHHEVKRPRLSTVGSLDRICMVSEVSQIEGAILDLPENVISTPLPCHNMFVFTAMKTHSRSACSRSRFQAKSFNRQCSSLVRPKIKGKSMLTFRASSVFCRFAATEKVVCSKRKDEDSIQFDCLFHPPFKKRRLCVMLNSVCNSSYVSCVSSTSGVSTGPRFVV